MRGPSSSGRRFGVLVHALLAAVPLDAPQMTSAISRRCTRACSARTDDERDAAALSSSASLRHPLLDGARAALTAGPRVPS